MTLSLIRQDFGLQSHSTRHPSGSVRSSGTPIDPHSVTSPHPINQTSALIIMAFLIRVEHREFNSMRSIDWNSAFNPIPTKTRSMLAGRTNTLLHESAFQSNNSNEMVAPHSDDDARESVVNISHSHWSFNILFSSRTSLTQWLQDGRKASLRIENMGLLSYIGIWSSDKHTGVDDCWRIIDMLNFRSGISGPIVLPVNCDSRANNELYGTDFALLSIHHVGSNK